MTDSINGSALLDRILDDARVLWLAHRERHPQLPYGSVYEAVSAAEDADGEEMTRIEHLLIPGSRRKLLALAADPRVWGVDSGWVSETIPEAIRCALQALIGEAVLDLSPTVAGPDADAPLDYVLTDKGVACVERLRAASEARPWADGSPAIERPQ